MQWAFALFPWALSALAIGWMLRARPRTRGAWGIRALASASVAAFAFVSGAWAFTSQYFSYAALALFIAATAHAYRAVSRREMEAPGRSKSPGHALAVSVLAVFGMLDLAAVAARVAPAGAIDVQFPLRSGTYYVLQGGDSVVTNPFHVASGTPLALDIVKLNAFGNRAAGIAPDELGAYAIFDDEVRSPCGGSVIRVRDGLADNPPAHPDIANASGNHVILRCGDAEIVLAHFQRGSVAVADGQPVRAGQPLGRVGNSGHTMEPHLHVDAKVGTSAMPLVFGGRFLSAGDTIRSEKD